MATTINWNGDTSVPNFANPLGFGAFYLAYKAYFPNADKLNGTFTLSDGSTLASTPTPYYDESGTIVAYSLNNRGMYIQKGTWSFTYNSNKYEVEVPETGIYFYFFNATSPYATTLYLPNSNIIKAGTYRFKDDINFPSSGFSDYFSLPITIPTIKYDSLTIDISGITALIVGSSIDLAIPNSILFIRIDGSPPTISSFPINANGVTQNVKGYCPIYKGEWCFAYYLDSPLASTPTEIITDAYSPYFIVNKDTEISDETMFTWFTENTQMLIKAGTYRWNDDVEPLSTTIDGERVNLKLKVKPFNLVGNIYNGVVTTDIVDGLMYLRLKVNDIDMTLLAYGNTDDSKFNIYLNGQTIITTGAIIPLLTMPPVYTTRWTPYYLDNQNDYQSIVSIVGAGALTFGQIVEVIEDKYVPTTFGLWANENWQEYSEEPKTTIKKGTYLFNEEITKPTSDLEQEVNFTTPGFPVGNVGGLEVYGCTGIRALKDKNYLYYNVDSSALSGWWSVYSYTKDQDGFYHWMGDYRKVTIPEDTPVSTEFFTWFDANTKPAVSKKFARLYIGNTVATAGSKCFKKLTTQTTQ